MGEQPRGEHVVRGAVVAGVVVAGVVGFGGVVGFVGAVVEVFVKEYFVVCADEHVERRRLE